MSDATPMSERVAEEVRVLLARRRLSASELARRINQTQRYVSRRLSCEVAFDVDDLERIAAALEVEVAELLPAPVRRSGQRTTSDSSHQAERPTAERLMAAQIHPDHETHRPADAAPRPAEIRAGTRRPRIRSYTHGR